jgi:penicillin amidase
VKPLSLLIPVLILAGCTAGADDGASDVQARLTDMANSVLAQIDGDIRVPGLGSDVEVIRDASGIAHIYASNQEDLFFAQGFVAAQDRLWEIDVWRRYAEGRASEIVGPERFETDRLYRLMKYRGSRTEDLASYHPDAEAIFSSFASGVNAYIQHIGDDLPVEFEITGTTPEPWTADLSSLRLIQRAASRGRQEVQLARDVVRMGAEEANRRRTPDPYVPLEIPAGLDLEAIAEHADAIMDALRGDFNQILRAPVLPEYQVPEPAPMAGTSGSPDEPGSLPGTRRVAMTDGLAGPGLAAQFSLADLLEQPLPDLPGEFREQTGSNNWVLSPRMTTTGSVILANDPHRQISNPSLRYIVHLNAPGWNVIGSGEPSLPGVAIGHNDRVAWGLTIVGTDQDDLYQETVNPENRNQVRWQGEWEELRVVIDTIMIRGEAPRVVELKYSRHGPIVYEDTDNNYAYALRTVLHEPGTAHYMGALRVDQAQNCEEFLEAMAYWKTPSENMICGDVEGNIAWKAAALTPDRAGKWHGRLPVPGTGEYEWQGFREDLPEEYNPERGWIATANHNIQPDGFSPPLMFKVPPYRRFERLEDILSDSTGFSVEDNIRLQLDAFHYGAAEAAPLFVGWTADDPQVEQARRLLSDWDHVFAEESAAAALYFTWNRVFSRTHREASIPDNVPEGSVASSLRMAVDSLSATQGSDPAEWRWGRSNRVAFPHPLSAAFDLPAVERRGGAGTVSSNGGTYKQIIDLSDWDDSRVLNAPGQSGQPGSPFYDSLLDEWKNGEYQPYLFTREAVEENAVNTLRLVPGG